MQEKNEITVDGVDDNALFVMRFKWWRVLWRLFVPFSIGVPMFFMIAVKWAFSKTGFIFWLIEIVSIIVVVASIWMIFEMLLTNCICLYGDRIVLRYKKWKRDKQIPLRKAKYVALTTPLYGQLIISNEDNRWDRILFDPTLISAKEIKEFYRILATLSGRDIEELKYQFRENKLIA